MLPSQTKIGVIGGGQLGKMLIEASQPWNVKYTVLESTNDCPASNVAQSVICGSLYDESKIRELAAVVDVMTFEIEHINVDALLKLEAEGKRIIPSPRVLKIIQDKGVQKQFYLDHKIPTSFFIKVENDENISEILNQINGEKVVVKNCTGGYDGKGVRILKKTDILAGIERITEPSIIEEFQNEMLEISVIVARNEDGDIVTYDPIEMYFDPHSNLVEFLFSPANISSLQSNACKKVAKSSIESLDGIGVFAVELFLDSNGTVMVNEIAPRPHNSGHHTIEGSFTSQFEQLNRILLNLPLGNSEMICPAAMLNLVGPPNLFGNYLLDKTEKLLKTDGVYIHLYNKKEIKPNRKMGHVTVLANDLDALILKAESVKQYLSFAAVV